VHLLPPCDPVAGRRGDAMLDFLMLVYGVAFFAIAILYVIACERM
jgi:hypothetical protein